MHYSTTARCVDSPNDLEAYFRFMDYLKATPFDSVNLCFAEFPELLNESFDIIGFKERFSRYGFGARYAHGPYEYPFLYHLKDGSAWHTAMLKALEITVALAIPYFVIHIGFVVDEAKNYDMKASYRRNLAYLKPYIAFAAGHGLKIALENGTGQPTDSQEPLVNEVIPKFDELIRLAETFNAEYGREVCGVCFDTGHANFAGDDLPGEIRKVGKLLWVNHLHDNYGDADAHNPLGEGNIDWQAVKAAFGEIGCIEEYSLEHYYDNNPEYQRDPVAYLNATYQKLRLYL